MLSFTGFNEQSMVSLIKEAKQNESVAFAFGRFNPPTSGHEKLVNLVLSTAAKKHADALIFTSKTQEPAKNPLEFKDKIKYLKKLFPKVNVIDDPKMVNIFVVLKMLSEAGYKDVSLIAGGDRTDKFDSEVRKYIKHNDPKKSLDFDAFKVYNAGERANEISASEMRAYAKQNDLESFSKGLPSTANKSIAQSLFKDVRTGMKLS